MQASLRQVGCGRLAAAACSRRVQPAAAAPSRVSPHQPAATPPEVLRSSPAAAVIAALLLPAWRRLTCCAAGSRSPDTARPAATTGHNSSNSRNSSNSSSSSSGGTEGSIISYAPSSVGGWVVNKQPINASMTPQLYGYLLNLTKEHQVLAALREETAGIHGGHMQISPEQGQFMSVLVKLMGVQSAIEVGVFTGYSSLAVALALPPGGRLVAFDRDAKTMEVARKYWQLAGVQDKVDARLGPGLEGLQQLLQESGPHSFDFAFIDADKGGYRAYFDLCLQLVRPGGCVAVDNVLFYGRVVDSSRDDKATAAIRQFNEALAADPRVEFSIVPIGDGVALCRKL